MAPRQLPDCDGVAIARADRSSFGSLPRVAGYDPSTALSAPPRIVLRLRAPRGQCSSCAVSSCLHSSSLGYRQYFPIVANDGESHGDETHVDDDYKVRYQLVNLAAADGFGEVNFSMKLTMSTFMLGYPTIVWINIMLMLCVVSFLK